MLEGDLVRKYTYKNATVYITKPTEQIVKEATETFLRKVVKEQIQNESGRRN